MPPDASARARRLAPSPGRGKGPETDKRPSEAKPVAYALTPAWEAEATLAPTYQHWCDSVVEIACGLDIYNVPGGWWGLTGNEHRVTGPRCKEWLREHI